MRLIALYVQVRCIDCNWSHVPSIQSNTSCFYTFRQNSRR